MTTTGFSVLSDMAEWLQQRSIVLPGVDIFRTMLPEAPDRCLALAEYAGSSPVRSHSRGAPPSYERPRFQVLARDLAEEDARLLIRSVFDALLLISNQTIGSARYLLVVALQSPFLLERDANGRHVYGCNFEAWGG